MRVSDSYRSVGTDSRLHAGAVKLDARLLALTGLLLCFLPPSLVAQTAREVQAETAIQAAKEAQQKGDYPQAVAGYQAAVKLMPETAELYGNLGIAYYLERDYPKAVEACRQALKRKPGLEGPNLYLGMSYIRMSQFADSIKPLQKAITINPKLKLAYMNLGVSYNEVGKSEEALQVLQKAEKVFPDDEDILYSLGSQHYEMMFKAYKKMATVAPNSYRYDQVLGKSFEERQEFGNAIVEYKQALKTNPQAPGLHGALGNIYWIAGRYDEAIPELEAELQIVPNVLAKLGIKKVDAILFDLGLSSDELDLSGRAFFFKNNEPLLMTFSESKDQKVTAEIILNN